jgi:signal transduction histidine kinase
MQTPQDETTQIFISEIKRSLNSFLEMLLNFKKFYRKPYLEKTNINISKLINKIITQYSVDIKSKNILINLDNLFNGELYIDPILFEEVISNLLVNAIYFCPQNERIKIKAEVIFKEFIFEISNNGPNIKEEDLENVFNPFFTTKSSGSGLGLAISKSIIEAHEGVIEAQNNKDCVSFIIKLPIIKDILIHENISS